MPALIPVDNTLGALLIGTVLSSTLVDSANLVFGIYPTYHLLVTNFGDYEAVDIFTPWSQAALGLSTVILEASVQHFYAYRIYRLGWRSLYLPIAISVSSLTEFGAGIGFSTYMMAASFENVYFSFDGSFTAILSCKVLCDVLITVGMVYTLMSNRTHVRRTNNVLNLLAIYTINCGILHLVFAVTCVILFVRYPDTLIYTTPSFIMVRLSLCAFMSMYVAVLVVVPLRSSPLIILSPSLNSRDHLRETLDNPEGAAVVVTLTQTSRRGPQPGAGAAACETPPSKDTPTGQPSRSVLHQFRFPSTRRSEKTASYLLTETNSTRGM
ncbi:hypothetical protein EDB92DRAFT_1986086 [Lactarius akahatsu]|uniref:DUF6534 domain-containing protein n=1 Tax=Lactarius akahatsu TaxID=416441 RepID=A0AAD4LL16_9AGAM|nr:hypothetical protein EDB92DRAFT_1986086 [Lactarius akahatsu]